MENIRDQTTRMFKRLHRSEANMLISDLLSSHFAHICETKLFEAIFLHLMKILNNSLIDTLQ